MKFKLNLKLNMKLIFLVFIVPVLGMAHGEGPDKVLKGAIMSTLEKLSPEAFTGIEAILKAEKVEVKMFLHSKVVNSLCEQTHVNEQDVVVCKFNTSGASTDFIKLSITSALDKAANKDQLAAIKAWPEGEEIKVKLKYQDGSIVKVSCHTHGDTDCH